MYEDGARKLTVPATMSMTASPTKKGPAAPVTLSPHRSSFLKHRKTTRVHMLGIEPSQVEDEANILCLKTVWREEGKLSAGRVNG